MLQFLFRPREYRLRLCQEVEVKVSGSSAKPMVGQVIDVSSNGIGLWLPSPVTNSAVLELEAGELEITAEVCYCQPQDGGFRAGLFVKERRMRQTTTAGDSRSSGAMQDDSRTSRAVRNESRLLQSV